MKCYEEWFENVIKIKWHIPEKYIMNMENIRPPHQLSMLPQPLPNPEFLLFLILPNRNSIDFYSINSFLPRYSGQHFCDDCDLVSFSNKIFRNLIHMFLHPTDVGKENS